MKLRVFVAVLCLIVSLAVSSFSFFTVRNTCVRLADRTFCALSASDDDLPEQAIALISYYADACASLRFFLGRKDIDALQTAAETVSSYTEQGDAQQLRQALTAFAVSVRVLSDGEIPKCENIF